MSNFIPDLDQLRDGANFLVNVIRRAFRAIEAKFPIDKEDIDSVYGSVIDYNGAPTLPIDVIPLQDIIDATTAAGSSAMNCLDVLRGMVVQYRDDNELYFGPGHVLHRGIFKKQTCNDDGTWVSANAASLTIPSECPTSPGTTTNLEGDSWYYVYAKLDVAGDAPEYRISKTPPVICDGQGPEHPTYPKMRFLGSFRTTAAPDAAIRPFHRYKNGRVFWREIKLGPGSASQLGTYPFNDVTGGFVDLDISAQAPPSASCIFFSSDIHQESIMWTRVAGDVASQSGYMHTSGVNVGRRPDLFAELPVHAMDPMTDMPSSQTEINWFNSSPDNYFYVVGYMEDLL